MFCILQQILIFFLQGVSSISLATSMEFLYTGKCSFNYEDVFPLLRLANMYESKESETDKIHTISNSTGGVRGDRLFDFAREGRHCEEP